MKMKEREGVNGHGDGRYGRGVHEKTSEAVETEEEAGDGRGQINRKSIENGDGNGVCTDTAGRGKEKGE
jgi:hypothetical protein